MLEYNCEKTYKPEKCKNKKCYVDLILTILISALTLTIGIIIGNILVATLILQPAIIISIILFILIIVRTIMLVCEVRKC